MIGGAVTANMFEFLGVPAQIGPNRWGVRRLLFSRRAAALEWTRYSH